MRAVLVLSMPRVPTGAPIKPVISRAWLAPLAVTIVNRRKWWV